METKIINPSQINLAVTALKKGKTIAFKTDTIFGFSCLASNKTACQNLLKIKGRENKPLIILLGKNMNLDNFVLNIPEKAKKIIGAFWPGPLTIIFDLKYPFCDEITCGKKTIALRVPNHELTQNLIEKVGEPIVSTSANLSGQKSLNSVDEIFKIFNKKIPYILNDFDNNSSQESSTIISCINDEIVVLREGKIKKEDLKNFL